MKAFNLQEALAGKQVVTREGSEVRIFGVNDNAAEYDKLGGWIYLDGGGDVVASWSKEGEHVCHNGLDLFMKPTKEKRTVWVNVYKDEFYDGFHKTNSSADEAAGNGRINCVELTYEVEV